MTLTKKSKHDLMYSNINRQGEALNAIFNTGLEPVALCKKLFRLEHVAHRLATDYCNGVIDSEQAEKQEAVIITKLGKILFGKRVPDVPVFVNMDCRGYALKIDSEWLASWNKAKSGHTSVYQDWGGYGILAPDFRVNA